jgi:hypothetical protein
MPDDQPFHYYEKKHPTLIESVVSTIIGDHLTRRQKLWRSLTLMVMLLLLAFGFFVKIAR